MIKSLLSIRSFERVLERAVTLKNPFLTAAAAVECQYSSLQRPQAIRSYRGEAKDHAPLLTREEEALLKIASPKLATIYERHTRLPGLASVPKGSLGPDSNENDLDIRRKRLVYRSKQRGWLEVDLLLGTWASENVPTLTEDELDQFEAFVNQETIDIYNIITLRLDIPDDLKTPDKNSVVERIQEWARGNPLGKADPATYEKVKTEHNLT